MKLERFTRVYYVERIMWTSEALFENSLANLSAGDNELAGERATLVSSIAQRTGGAAGSQRGHDELS